MYAIRDVKYLEQNIGVISAWSKNGRRSGRTLGVLTSLGAGTHVYRMQWFSIGTS